MAFIKATEIYNDFDNPVPAYYFRRSFTAERACRARLRMAACGFYELHLNGRDITRGMLAPYISNPDDIVFYDEYDVELEAGENTVAFLLGNGFQNDPGGYIWDFDKADFRSAPMAELTVTAEGETLLVSDGSFRTAPSPIRSDDYRFGELYDANCELEGWDTVGLEESGWGHALTAQPPRGVLCPSDIDPILPQRELKAVTIMPVADGYIYDFGASGAGVCRLRIRGERGQRVELRHADALKGGDLDLEPVWFLRDCWERDRLIVHRDCYICRGEGEECYQPRFTYHGFRYVKVSGITREQATEELLTCIVCHTQLKTAGGFACSDAVATRLQEMTRQSIATNFHHFPTDCPQREKNGWTADAALSCEAAVLNYTPERNYRQWMRCICLAQREDGSLPGIVPTGGWGFHWGNGPAWDSVLVWIPYYCYIYRGETDMITESAPAFGRYLRYLRGRTDERGLLCIGLGDWCPVGMGQPKAPLIFTDTVMAMDIAGKMALLLSAVGMEAEAAFARQEQARYREAIRSHLIDPGTLLAAGECQSSQAMALHYGVYDSGEEAAAFDRLLEMVHGADDHLDVGVLGGRVLFRVLSRFGHSDLAFKMITRPDYPSYGNWLLRGATALWEDFRPDTVSSRNHHFWGDISAWFMTHVAGIRINPGQRDVNTVTLAPGFVETLSWAAAWHEAPAGRVRLLWKREGERILLEAEIPQGMAARLELESGWCLEDGTRERVLTSGCWTVLREEKK